MKKEMAQMQSENEALLAKAREERSQMMREAKEMRDKIIQEAKDQARKETNKIVADAQDVINQQKMAAITDLKNQVGNLVLEVSEKVLRRELNNKEDQEKYIQQLAQHIELN
jgi:F-type H+-transporting ATPase subunit b